MDKKNLKIVIVSGGGGHFAPALAVIDALPKTADVLVIGRKHAFEGDKSLSFEYQTAQKKGLHFYPITTGRLQRTLSPHTIPSLLKIPYGFWQSLKILKKFSPDIVLSFGGYTAVPVAYAASLLRIPIVVHEQTTQAGLANKLVSTIAQKICISWPDSAKFFPPKKVVLTGNPIRFARKIEKKSTPNVLPVIYITGGSGGSHTINTLVEGCIENLLRKFEIIHQTGDATAYQDFERLTRYKATLSDELKMRYTLFKFVDSYTVSEIMQNADLVVSRAGINTLTELLYLGKPCLLIPLPFAQKNEQLKNAQMVVQSGIGELLEEKNATSGILYSKITEMIDKISKYCKNSKVAQDLVFTDSAERVIRVIYDVLR